MKKSLIPDILIVILIVVLIIFLIVNTYTENKKVRETNVKMYNYLICIDDCDIVYTVDVGTLNVKSVFNETCTEDCAEKIGTMSFSPGELERGRLLMESNEYQECVRLLNVKGAEFYKNCVEKMLPMFEERYPEVKGE